LTEDGSAVMERNAVSRELPHLRPAKWIIALVLRQATCLIARAENIAWKHVPGVGEIRA